MTLPAKARRVIPAKAAVIPAKAGIHAAAEGDGWIPAFAAMTALPIRVLGQ